MGSRGGLDTLGPSRRAVDTHRLADGALAGLKDVGGVGGGDVPPASHDVVNVLAVLGRVGAEASTDTELVVGHEVGPFVVLHVRAEGVAVEKTTDGVPIRIRPMRIELSSIIPSPDIRLRKVANTGNLDVLVRLHPVHALEGSVRDGAGSTAGFGAPGDTFALGVADDAVGGVGTPDTEVVYGVDPSSLAVRRLARPSPAVVRPELTVLRLLRQRVDVVSSVPDLVGWSPGALADLDVGTVFEVVVGHIQTLATVTHPLEVEAPFVVEPLLVVALSGARPDLQLHAIRVLALGNIQALVAEHPNLRVAESPALGLGVGACANDDGRSVGVALDGKTLAGVKTGLDQHRSELRRSLRIDDSEERCERSGEGNGGLHRTREEIGRAHV